MMMTVLCMMMSPDGSLYDDDGSLYDDVGDGSLFVDVCRQSSV